MPGGWLRLKQSVLRECRGRRSTNRPRSGASTRPRSRAETCREKYGPTCSWVWRGTQRRETKMGKRRGTQRRETKDGDTKEGEKKQNTPKIRFGGPRRRRRCRGPAPSGSRGGSRWRRAAPDHTLRTLAPAPAAGGQGARGERDPEQRPLPDGRVRARPVQRQVRGPLPPGPPARAKPGWTGPWSSKWKRSGSGTRGRAGGSGVGFGGHHLLSSSSRAPAPPAPAPAPAPLHQLRPQQPRPLSSSPTSSGPRSSPSAMDDARKPSSTSTFSDWWTQNPVGPPRRSWEGPAGPWTCSFVIPVDNYQPLTPQYFKPSFFMVVVLDSQ